MKEFNTYLIFNGNATEAMRFYAESLKGDLQLTTFEQAQVPCPENEKHHVMHANIMRNGATLLMASDILSTTAGTFILGNNFSISIQTESVEETASLFSSLSKNGILTMSPQETPWAHSFAMFTDKFGVNWMLNFMKAHM